MTNYYFVRHIQIIKVCKVFYKKSERFKVELNRPVPYGRVSFSRVLYSNSISRLSKNQISIYKDAGAWEDIEIRYHPKTTYIKEIITSNVSLDTDTLLDRISNVFINHHYIDIEKIRKLPGVPISRPPHDSYLDTPSHRIIRNTVRKRYVDYIRHEL